MNYAAVYRVLAMVMVLIAMLVVFRGVRFQRKLPPSQWGVPSMMDFAMGAVYALVAIAFALTAVSFAVAR